MARDERAMSGEAQGQACAVYTVEGNETPRHLSRRKATLLITHCRGAECWQVGLGAHEAAGPLTAPIAIRAVQRADSGCC